MTVCICALTLSVISATSADLGTTQQFTARGIPEANPLMRPFVEGPGGRGEVMVGAVTTAAYFMLARNPGIESTVIQSVALAVHAFAALHNTRSGSAQEVPLIILPVLVLSW